MAKPVVQTAMCTCSFGTVPAPLRVTSQQTVTICGGLAATLFDGVPLLNVSSFGMCSNSLNPAVAAATAEAFGKLTPAPCMPATVVWMPGSSTVQVCGKKLLQDQSILRCSYGGIIRISRTPAAQVTVP